jgi:hypothetical protein
VCHTDVTLDRREAHAEGSRHLTFTHPPLYSLDDPLTQVFGVRFHLSIVSCGSVALQLALGQSGPNDPNMQRKKLGTPGVLRLNLGAGSYSWKFVHIAGETFTDWGSDQCH